MIDEKNISQGTWRQFFEGLIPGIKTPWHKVQILGLCPFHNDHHPSLSINTLNSKWKCFSCQTSGNSLTLLDKLGKPRTLSPVWEDIPSECHVEEKVSDEQILYRTNCLKNLWEILECYSGGINFIIERAESDSPDLLEKARESLDQLDTKTQSKWLTYLMRVVMFNWMEVIKSVHPLGNNAMSIPEVEAVRGTFKIEKITLNPPPPDVMFDAIQWKRYMEEKNTREEVQGK